MMPRNVFFRAIRAYDIFLINTPSLYDLDEADSRQYRLVRGFQSPKSYLYIPDMTWIFMGCTKTPHDVRVWREGRLIPKLEFRAFFLQGPQKTPSVPFEARFCPFLFILI